MKHNRGENSFEAKRFIFNLTAVKALVLATFQQICMGSPEHANSVFCCLKWSKMMIFRNIVKHSIRSYVLCLKMIVQMDFARKV